MPVNKKSLTRAEENTILQLIRRGENVFRIARIVGVPISAVEEILEKNVSKEMGW